MEINIAQYSYRIIIAPMYFIIYVAYVHNHIATIYIPKMQWLITGCTYVATWTLKIIKWTFCERIKGKRCAIFAKWLAPESNLEYYIAIYHGKVHMKNVL